MKLFFGDEDKTKDKKLAHNLIIIAIICAVFLIAVSSFKDNSKSTNANVTQNGSKDENQYTDYEKATENKLKSVLGQIDGVGKVNVMITFENGEEQVPAINVTDSKNYTEEKDNEGGNRNTTQENNGSTVVMSNTGDKSQPFIVKTLSPKVTGVIVVAEGADDRVVSLSITNAVMDIFNLSPDKVNVLPMKK